MRVDKTMENMKSCLCLICPSYTTICMHKNKTENLLNIKKIKSKKHLEIMFCAFDKSTCIHENKGCLCSRCPVHRKYELNNEDYCIDSGGVR